MYHPGGDDGCGCGKTVAPLSDSYKWRWFRGAHHTAFRFNGRCDTLIKNVLEVINLAALEIYLQYPDRNDRKLNIGDATPVDGSNCPGHPPGSHQNSSAVDLDYYTFATNVTQYRDSVIEKTKIWEDGNLTEIFDWERNYQLWRLLQKMLPGLGIATHIVIKEYMGSQIKAVYGVKEQELFNLYVQGDENPAYHHDTHAHLYLQNVKINWNCKI